MEDSVLAIIHDFEAASNKSFRAVIEYTHKRNDSTVHEIIWETAAKDTFIEKIVPATYLKYIGQRFPIENLLGDTVDTAKEK